MRDGQSEHKTTPNTTSCITLHSVPPLLRGKKPSPAISRRQRAKMAIPVPPIDEFQLASNRHRRTKGVANRRRVSTVLGTGGVRVGYDLPQISASGVRVGYGWAVKPVPRVVPQVQRPEDGPQCGPGKQEARNTKAKQRKLPTTKDTTGIRFVYVM